MFILYFICLTKYFRIWGMLNYEVNYALNVVKALAQCFSNFLVWWTGRNFSIGPGTGALFSLHWPCSYCSQCSEMIPQSYMAYAVPLCPPTTYIAPHSYNIWHEIGLFSATCHRQILKRALLFSNDRLHFVLKCIDDGSHRFCFKCFKLIVF